jgi:hypothetical protein
MGLARVLERLAQSNSSSLKKDSKILYPYDAESVFSHFGMPEERKEFADISAKAGELRTTLYFPAGGYMICDAEETTLTGYSQLESGLVIPDWLASLVDLHSEPYTETVQILVPEHC